MPLEPLLSLVNNQLVDEFPNPLTALAEPDGLLAAGGDLTNASLLEAYGKGIFPWYSDGQPILWWCPSERSILHPGEVKLSRSLKKTMRRGHLQVTIDSYFSEVIRACAAPRATQTDTWITRAMHDAYIRLHHNGHAHSIECSQNGELVGGLYGVTVGRAFFGESMFSRVSDASKVALITLSNHLLEWGYELIDCQIHNPHLASMGAQLIPRREFVEVLQQITARFPSTDAWKPQGNL
jgi:leucyl/phenylalanyl-tRNA---protein transferase